jgi:hypothetical protein
MRNRTGLQTAPPGPAGSCPPPPTHNQPDDDGDADLNAYIARLAAAAPPLSGQQRDTLALLLRRPRRR